MTRRNGREHVGWATSLVLALALVLAGFSSSSGMLALAAAGIVSLALLIGCGAAKCRGRHRCALLDYLTLGSSAALAPLAFAALAGVAAKFLVPAIFTAALLAGVSVFASFVLRCRGTCCDEVDREPKAGS